MLLFNLGGGVVSFCLVCAGFVFIATATPRPRRGVLWTCYLFPASCLGALVHGALSFCPSFSCLRAWSTEYDSYFLKPRSRGLSLKNFLRFSFSSALCWDWGSALPHPDNSDCTWWLQQICRQLRVCHVILVTCSCDSPNFRCPSISSVSPCQEGTGPTL